MKKFLQYLLLIILFSTLGIILTNRNVQTELAQKAQIAKRAFIKPCSSPIKYSIGEVDPRFGISKDQLAAVADQAAHIWEDPTGKNLFEYDPNSSFKINLVFDERQKQTLEYKSLENNLNSLESSHDSLKKEYDAVHKNYQQRLDNYDSMVADYKKQLNDFNDKVSSWNKKGGAPEDVYNELKNEKKDLDALYDKIETERKAINSLAGKSNDLAQKEGQIVNSYNSSVETYQNKYGQASEFDKGVYDGQKIDIFQFKEITDLRLTLVHEMGHALGIDHLENPKSIMYYLMSEQDMNSPALSDEDLAAVKNVCGIK